MGKILVLILLVTVLKCNGHIPIIGDFVPAAQKQVNGALGFASSVLGSITSGIGLNFGGQLGLNVQNRPEQNTDEQYVNTPQGNPENIAGVDNRPNENNYSPPNLHRPQPPPHRPQNDYNSHRPNPPHYGKPGGYGYGHGNHGHYQENQNQYGYNNYNNYRPHSEIHPIRPGHPSQQYEESYGNNGNYGNHYPSNMYNTGYSHHGSNYNKRPNNDYQSNHDNQGYNHNNQFHQNDPGRPTHQNPQGYNKPAYGNNNQHENNQESLLNQIFGNPQHPHPELNSGTQNPNNNGFTAENQNSLNSNPNNKPEIPSSPASPPSIADSETKEPEDDLPTFVPLTPMDVKREAETKKPAADEEFEIDIRFKNK